MEEIILKNIAYSYYPKGVCSVNHYSKYLESVETIRLISILNTYYQKFIESKEFNSLIDEFKKNEFLKNVEDKTSLSWDRCINLNIDFLREESKLTTIFINISLLIPYYIIYVKENEIQSNPFIWITLPERNQHLENIDYKEQIELISDIIEKVINFKKFPEEMINLIIPDLSYQDNRLGSFTMFNAFFNDDKI